MKWNKKRTEYYSFLSWFDWSTERIKTKSFRVSVSATWHCIFLALGNRTFERTTFYRNCINHSHDYLLLHCESTDDSKDVNKRQKYSHRLVRIDKLGQYCWDSKLNSLLATQKTIGANEPLIRINSYFIKLFVLA